MKIRTQLIFTLSLFGLLLIGIAVSLLLTNRQVNQLRQQEEIAHRIERRANELSYLSGDYLMYGESQQRARWESSFASFSVDVSGLNPVNPEQQAIVDHIKADQERLQAIFTDVVSIMEGPAQTSSGMPGLAFNQVSWSRMEVQNRSIAFEASLLSRQLRGRADQLKQMNSVLIFILIGIFGAYLFISYYLIDRRTLRSITELQAGTAIIGSGNLDFTIAVKRADEIGDLSHAFNQMAAHLKEVTASKADLEREIAERQRAEEVLRLKEAELNEAQRIAHVGSWYWDVKTDVTTGSDELLRIYGFDPETQSMPDFKEQRGQCYPAEDWERVNAAVQKTLEAGDGYELDVRALRGGTTIWITTRSEVVRDAEGQIVGLRGTVQDITERKEAEETLHRNKSLLQAVLDNVPEAIYLKDRDSRLLLANPATLTVIGKPAAAVLGKTDAEFYDDRLTGLAIIENDQRIMNSGQIETIEESVSGSGGIRVYLSTKAPYYDAEGRIIGLIGVAREITERKRMEDTLQEVNEQLQAQAVEMELQAEELQAQKNELVSANEQLRFNEELANQRFLEIQAANKELQAARLAALNLMEDALAAQEQVKQINLRLRESEQRLNRAQEIAHLGSWELNLENNQLNWSDEVYRIFGLQPQEFGATYEAFLEAVHPEDRAAVDAAYSSSVRENRDSYEIEHRIIKHPSGEIRVVHEKCEHFRNETRQIVRSVGMVHDITERKQAQERLDQLNHTLKALNRSNQAMLRSRSETELLNEVCKIIIEDCGHAMVWIGFKEEDEQQSVRPVASAGFEAGYLETLKITWADTERGRGPTGTAIRTGESRRCRNMLTDPQFAPWREQALERGYASSIVLPLKNEDSAFGAITIYSRQPDSFAEEEEQLLRELANDLAYGIVALRLRAAHAQAEEALRLSEEKFRSAFADAAIGFAMTLPDGRFLDANPAYCRLTGYEIEELQTTEFSSLVHPDDRAENMKLIDQILTGEIDDFVVENRYLRKDGEAVWVRKSVSLVHNAKNAPQWIIALVEDITERKQVEEALRRSEALLTQTGEMAKVGGWELDVQTMTLLWSLETYHIHEVDTALQPSVENAINFYAAEAQPVISEAVSRAINEGQSYDLELPFITAKGKQLWIRTMGHSEFQDGKCVRLFGAFQDITERKQAEAALRKAHDELELRVQERTRELVKEIAERKEIEKQLRIRTTAMEAAANGIIITDPHGNIQWANPALTQISGYEARDLIGQSTHLFSSGQHDEIYYRHLWESILSGQVWRGEITNRRKDGSLYMEEETITPVRDENDQIQHFIAVKQDITERKQAEAELAERNIKLQALSIAEHEQRQLSESLAEAALALNKSMKLDEVLPLILEQVKAVIPYQLAIIMMFDGESFYDASHEGDPRWSHDLSQVKNRFPLEDFPLLIKMRQSHQPVMIADTQKEKNWMIVHGLEWSRSILCVPLLAENQVIGFLNLLAERPDFFTTEMRDRLVVFASHAAVAIQNAWLFDQVRASNERLQSLSRRLVEIQENERLYIARELHDEAGQMLTSLMLDLVTLETQADQPKVILKKVPEMEEALNAISENLHNVAMALRPASLDHLGLVPALRQYVESVGERYKLRASFTAGNFQERLSANMETELYRIVQEALTNVARHAHASQVDVVLTVRDQKLIVIIEDDGNGFDPEKVPDTGHLGLFGMRERAEMIGGQLVIESKPGKGTTVMVEVEYDSPIVDRG